MLPAFLCIIVKAHIRQPISHFLWFHRKC